MDYLTLALIHAAPVVLVGFVASSRWPLHVTGAVMCVGALLVGSPSYAALDLMAAAIAWAVMAQIRDRSKTAAEPQDRDVSAVSGNDNADVAELTEQGGQATRAHQSQADAPPATQGHAVPDATHGHALSAGTRLNKYRLVRVLGVGGFGVTYLSEQTGGMTADEAMAGSHRAIKEYFPNEVAVRNGTGVVPKSVADRENFEWGLKRFLQEAETLARFNHRNIVRVWGSFEANDTAYIVLDYEDGESLDTLLRRHRRLTEAQLRRVVLPIVDGLRQVHAAGVLHRDIKPANVFVRRSDESPVLLDFGSAREALGRKSRSVTAIASAGYSPPEQYDSHGHHGPWTDIYALCALCHRAITGKTPTEAPRRQSMLLRTGSDPLPKLVDTAPDSYSQGLLEAVDWGLRVIETERPATLDEWLARVEGSHSARPNRPPRSADDVPNRSATPIRTGKSFKVVRLENGAFGVETGQGPLLGADGQRAAFHSFTAARDAGYDAIKVP